MSQGEEATLRNWKREEVERELKNMLVDALGVDEDRVVPEASLVHDLGAESIDFLDIGFRVQQTFGVELPNKAIQDKVLSWRNFREIGRLIEERYGAQLSAQDIKQLQTKGLPEVLRWLAENRGVAVANGEAERVAAALADRLAGQVESLGFKAALVNRDGIIQVLLENLNSPKIMEGMIRLLSVGALVDFIAARVCDGAGANG
ncbi:MAG: acyl carrier protein [Deltaproteobacteria bacterium]|nr:acyl carrier protein [Deltaproteobacteria bacterium]